MIRREFEKLHQFLWDEEEARITALKEEEEQRSQTMKKKIDKITIKISSVIDTINAIEKQIQGEDLPFLLVKQQTAFVSATTCEIIVWFICSFHTINTEFIFLFFSL